MKAVARWLFVTWAGRGVLSLPLLLVVVGIVAVFGYQAWQRRQDEEKLRAVLVELDRSEPGWRLGDLEAARAPVAEADNSAPVIARAATLLGNYWPDADFEGRFDSLEPEEQLTEEQVVSLRWKLDGARSALDEARNLVGKPNGRYPMNFAPNPLNAMKLTHQMETRSVTLLLMYDGWRRAHDGDRHGAAESCRAAFHAARCIGEDPLIISQLVRLADVAVASRLVERVLAQIELGPDDLQALQRLVEQEEQYPGWEISLRGERAFQHEVFEAFESGVIPLDKADIKEFQPSWFDSLTGRSERDLMRAQHPVTLTWLTEYLRVARRPESERETAQAALDRRLDAEGSPLGFTRTLLPALRNLESSYRRNKALLRCLAAALAVERYRLLHKQGWPESLQRLTPDLLPAVPTDPYDGQPLRYRRTETGVVVYSVGPDRTDNDGRLSVDGKPDTDIGYRLFDVRPLIKAPKPLVGPPEPPDDEPDEPLPGPLPAPGPPAPPRR
jgi:hypothetical protein